MKYPGGKGYLLDDILSLYRKFEAKTVVEPFGGSAKFLLNIQQMTLHGKIKVIYNDVDGRVANVFMQIKDHPVEMANKFEYAIQSREWYNICRDIPSNDKIEDAFRTLYVLLLGRPERSFDVMGWTLDTKNELNGIMDRIKSVHDIVRGWLIENDDFGTVIERYDSPHTFYYLDPPYYGTDMYRYNFTLSQFWKLHNILERIKGKYVMNVNADPHIKDVFGEPYMAKTYGNVVNSDNRNRGLVRTDRIEWFYSNL